ncbi:hypothetical protein HI914_00678 [Erysiphe necator]|nr:hypothetical protein HI914_00678 [Erysiphe necator]
MIYQEDLQLLQLKARNDSLKRYIDNLEEKNNKLMINSDYLDKERTKLMKDFDCKEKNFINEISKLKQELKSLRLELQIAKAKLENKRDKNERNQKLKTKIRTKSCDENKESQNSIEDVISLLQNLKICPMI